ncbi:MAG: cysteine-rich CWC family protein [Oleispira sp.]
MAESKKEADKEHDSVLKVSATTCPRCSEDFVCNAADIKQCQCWGVGPGPDEFAYLKQQGFSAAQTGCLCRNCLLEIQREVADTANNSSSV